VKALKEAKGRLGVEQSWKQPFPGFMLYLKNSNTLTRTLKLSILAIYFGDSCHNGGHGNEAFEDESRWFVG
jgi:hypothetical protein